MTAKPITFSQVLADEILRRVASGESLRSICVEDGMPHRTTIQLWRRDNPGFYEAYSKAREFQAETIFDDMLNIADTPHIGQRKVYSDKNGETIHEEDMLGHRELQIRTRQWILPRLSKRMADKSQIDHTSSDNTMSPLTPEQQLVVVNKLHENARKRVAAKRQAKIITGFVGDDGSDLA